MEQRGGGPVPGVAGPVAGGGEGGGGGGGEGGKTDEGGGGKNCDICDVEASTHECKECNEVLCPVCLREVHAKLDGGGTHRVRRLGGLGAGGAGAFDGEDLLERFERSNTERDVLDVMEEMRCGVEVGCLSLSRATVSGMAQEKMKNPAKMWNRPLAMALGSLMKALAVQVSVDGGEHVRGGRGGVVVVPCLLVRCKSIVDLHVNPLPSCVLLLHPCYFLPT
jgi:hypothetical protein